MQHPASLRADADAAPAPARRQRHDNGNPQLVAQMSRAFKIPDAKAATSSNGAQAGAYERFIYLTQARSACLATYMRAVTRHEQSVDMPVGCV